MKNGDDSGIITSNVYDGEIYNRLNPLVERITGLVFRNIDFDAESLKTLRECSAENRHIVYASFHSSNISLLILYNLLRRHGFEPPVFSLEYNPFMLQTVGFVWRRIVKLLDQVILRRKYKFVLDTDHVRRLITGGKSIILSLMSRRFFIKRYMEIKYDSILHLIEVQKSIDTPIYLLPQMIFWNRNPERTGNKSVIWTSPRDILTSKATGDKGLISGWIATLKSPMPAYARITEPLNLREEIAASRSDDSRQIAMEIRNKLLGIYHHEKRTTLGPVIKSRQEMMEKVLYHRNVLDEIARLVREEGAPERKLRRKAYRYYREIAADYSLVYTSYFAKSVSVLLRKIFDGISYDPESIKMLREAAQRGPLVFTPCHKSHMDYLIISFLLFMNNMFPPHIAAGVNLSFWPMGVIFRHSGAFFLRRSFKGLKLYPVIFKQYIKTLVSEGYSIEFFIEGGRTRTGKLALPKLGFLNYLMDAIDEGYNTDLVFVPVAINYDRILEEQSYVAEVKGREKTAESVSAMVESRKLLKRKYGRVYVTFNSPFTLNEIKESGVGSDKIALEVANNVIRRINEVTVVTPFALATAAMLISAVKGFSRRMLVERITAIHRYFTAAGIRMSESLHDLSNLDEIVDYVIGAYMEDRIVEELRVEGSKKKEVVKDFYLLREDNRARIVFYKNSIIHYLAPLSMAAVAVLVSRKNGDTGYTAIREACRGIERLFSNEFVLPSPEEDDGLPFRREVFEHLRAENIISVDNDTITADETGADVLKYHAKIIQEYFESYLIVLHTVLNQRVRKMGRKDFIADVRRAGVRLYHTGEARLSESLSMPNYENAVHRLVDDGILVQRGAGQKNAEISTVDKDRALELFSFIKACLEVIA